MEAAFDNVAESYDTSFTDTLTGRYQRDQVWQHLDQNFPAEKTKRILEVNCGTGEDAIHLARRGHEVVATDISDKMIQIAMLKTPHDISNRLSFQQMNMLDIDILKPSGFDIIFSNFGGLNCLSPDQLNNFLDMISSLLNPNGRFVAVIMPKFCFMESLYFLFKLNFSKVFRRNTKEYLRVQLNDAILPIWYYTPKDIRLRLRAKGTVIQQKGIGILIPPSYLDQKFSKFKRLMKFFGKVDALVSNLAVTANFSDHFLIDIEMKQ